MSQTGSGCLPLAPPHLVSWPSRLLRVLALVMVFEAVSKTRYDALGYAVRREFKASLFFFWFRPYSNPCRHILIPGKNSVVAWAATVAYCGSLICTDYHSFGRLKTTYLHVVRNTYGGPQ